jgi:hypothetical protein
MEFSHPRPRLPVPHVFEIGGVRYQIQPAFGHAIAVSIFRDDYEFRDSISDGASFWPVLSLEVPDLPRSLNSVLIPRPVSLIDVSAFAECHWLRYVNFSANAQLREVRGFRGCGMMCVMIPTSVEIVTKTGFADCFSLEIVTFEADSHLREINGFRRCSITEIRIPSDVQLIGPSAFHGCRFLKRVKFARPVHQCIINGFAEIAIGAVIKIPDNAKVLPEAFGQMARLFLEYTEPALSRMRRGALERLPDHSDLLISPLPVPPDPGLSDDPATQIITSYTRLPLIADTRNFARSLTFRLRLRGETFHSTKSADRTRYLIPLTGGPNQKVASLESVLSMFAISRDFSCLVLRQTHSYHFTVTCDICGSLSSVNVICPFNGCDLTVSARNHCCGHMFVGQLPNPRRNEATVFVTNPDVPGHSRYATSHPIRKMARTLLLTEGELGMADAVLLRSWMTTTRRIRDGIAESVRGIDSLIFLLQQLPGHFHIYFYGAGEGREDGFMFEGQAVHSLRWVAPWAVDAFRGADFYELDASFKALKPYVYSVPLAVSKNVGIPLGLVLGPSESTEMFQIFAEGLIEHGLEMGQLRALALLSDEGSALVAYGERYHSIHLFCFRHWLEALGSRTLQAMLARRLLFARTRAAFQSILPQTLSDFMAGCEAGEITDAGREKFADIFGIRLPLPSDSGALPEMRGNTFEAQALWGVRGAKGVGTCSNHIEGLHGRLNSAARSHRTPLGRLAAVLHLLKAKAEQWPKKVAKSQRRIGAQLIKSAREQGHSAASVCPCSGDSAALCDQGFILSRRFGCRLPCIHTALRHDFGPEDPTDAVPHFRVSDQHIAIDRVVYRGKWGCGPATRSRATLTVDETGSDPFAMPELEWETTRFLRNLNRELFVATGYRRSERLDRLLVEFGRELGKLEAEEPQLSIEDRHRRAKSRLLVEQWKNRKRPS